jgi:hypothetical protein
MDAREVGNTALDTSPLAPGGLLHTLDHLLLAVNPVEVPAEHSQAHGLHDVRVLQGQAVGP